MTINLNNAMPLRYKNKIYSVNNKLQLAHCIDDNCFPVENLTFVNNNCTRLHQEMNVSYFVNLTQIFPFYLKGHCSRPAAWKD